MKSQMPTPEEKIPPQALIDFCKQLDTDSELRARIKAANNPHQIIEIASSFGYNFSALELRVWSKELVSDCFPWAKLGNKWRRNFFTSKD